MTTPNVQVRRATIEDLPKLVPLWKEENLPCEDLEKRFKEFQVVTAEDGEILGALGLQIAGLEGWLHSEAFAHPEQADEMRDKLWQRLQILAKNFGLFRVWTQHASPFWHTNGFQYANPDSLTKRPGAFAGDSHTWLFLQLKDEPQNAPVSVDKEFALFKEAEQERTRKMYQQAKVLKAVATGVAVGVMLLILVFLTIYFLKVKARQPLRPASIGATRTQLLAENPALASPLAFSPAVLRR